MKKYTKLGFLILYYLSLFGVTLLLTLSAGPSEDAEVSAEDSTSIPRRHKHLGE
ncbi:MAG: hypothetical protein QGG02_08495 [Gammaproteobacteria bacterium]|jgi:hypothetical protein|nr:hypothetical protein [Gammaproteobacteria bacterium]MDP6731433.1 hypothetical protein [Gammaproteobacteria bacterium]